MKKLQLQNRKNLLTQARNLGIKDPDSLDDDELRKVIGLYRDIKALRNRAKALGITLPKDIQHLGTLERIFLDEVERRLEGVKKDNKIRYAGKEWVVSKITRTRHKPCSRLMYTLRPVEGGRHSMVIDTSLLMSIEL